jgi:hypothetical protein
MANERTRVSLASGVGRTGPRERPTSRFALRRGLAEALAEAEASRGAPGGDAPRTR